MPDFPRELVIRLKWFVLPASMFILLGCSNPKHPEPADIVFVNGRVYTFAWSEPDSDGLPASDAPFMNGAWHPDATALAVRGDLIVFVGESEESESYVGKQTQRIDLGGATVLPGLIDSHVHIAELGQSLERVNLVGVASEAEAVRRIAERAAKTPAGGWIVGWGWDEGEWADHYPTLELLSREVPDHPAYLKGLHGFAVWGNARAFQQSGIVAATPDPSGGEILRNPDGSPSGVLLNRAGALLEDAVPTPTSQQLQGQILAGLQAMGEGGFTGIHEAGASRETIDALLELDRAGRLPLRVFAMLNGRDTALLSDWQERGPYESESGMLSIRSVKAYYDGALGSRGAQLLEDYSDQPGHRGVSGRQYGFDEAAIASMMRAGFQLGVHAIGDAGNRATLDFFERMLRDSPAIRSQRNRIEHAQVLHPDDLTRLAGLDIIASMQPPHAVEDKDWAEQRLGSRRIRGAYAWRSLRRARTRLVFNSDLPGSDHNIFYGLHSAVTRRDRDGEPAAGWYPEERVNAEEAIRGYSGWAAFSGFQETRLGRLEPGRLADLSVLSIDPLQSVGQDPGMLLDGQIEWTVVAGKVLFGPIRNGRNP